MNSIDLKMYFNIQSRALIHEKRRSTLRRRSRRPRGKRIALLPSSAQPQSHRVQVYRSESLGLIRAYLASTGSTTYEYTTRPRRLLFDTNISKHMLAASKDHDNEAKVHELEQEEVGAKEQNNRTCDSDTANCSDAPRSS